MAPSDLRFSRDLRYATLQLMLDPSDDPLPPCPAVRHGVAVRYLGIGRRRVEGPLTGLVYFVDQTRRLIEVDERDLAGILDERAFVRAD